MSTKTKKNAEKCRTCRKPLARVGHNGKFRCSNPECPVVFVGRDDDGKSKSSSRARWRG